MIRSIPQPDDVQFVAATTMSVNEDRSHENIRALWKKGYRCEVFINDKSKEINGWFPGEFTGETKQRTAVRL